MMQMRVDVEEHVHNRKEKAADRKQLGGGDCVDCDWIFCKMGKGEEEEEEE